MPWRAILTAALASALIGVTITDVLADHRAVSPASATSSVPQRSIAALPPAARAAASAAIGAGHRAFRVDPLGAGAFAASNAEQQLSARFTRRGVTVSSHGLRISLRLRALGYGGSLETVAPVTPKASGNRVTYAHAGVNEWYANGPLGLEQGFTVQRSARARTSGTFTLSLQLSTNALRSVSRNGTGLRIGRGVHALRYGGLLVTDARGRRLAGRLELRRGELLIRIATRGARYPLRVDPLVQQGAKLTPSDETGVGSEAGTSVAISADGNTALVGGIGDEAHGKPMEGAAWVFTRSGATWTEQAKLTGGGEAGEGQFGISVALSADGNTALIGGINDETAGKQVGAAWVFTRAGPTWTQQGAKLTGGAEEGVNGRFGRSVALSGDGNTALVGAYFDENSKAEPQSGSAFVFTRSGSAWKHEGPKLTGSDQAGLSEFGISVALSADGNTALIGGPNDEGGAKVSMTGAAWVFTRSGSSWAQQGGKLTGAGESGPGELGWSVALSADGNTALAGAPGDEDGAAFAFARTGSSWAQQGAKLAPSDATAGAAFGSGVALSADGTVALIGGPVDKDSTVPTGAAWEFARTGLTWAQQGSKILGSGEVPESEFGAAAALSADGDTALLGGPIDALNTGAAWVFVDPPPTATTGTASSITANAATLNGSVLRGASGTAHFDYGASTAYGSSTAPQGIEALHTGGPLTSQALSAGVGGLSPSTTYHFRLVTTNSAGTSVGADQTFTTTALGRQTIPLCRCAHPVLSHVSQSHGIWREGRRRARLSARRRAKPPVGTTFSFRLNVAAKVSFAFTQTVGGRRVNGKCVALKAKNRRRKPCRRTVTRAALSVSAGAGSRKLRFQGIAGRTKLKPGRYTVTLVASSGGLRSAPKSLSFTIVR